MTGEIESKRIDTLALKLKPLALNERWLWDTKDEYWGETEDPLNIYFKPIIDFGIRKSYEMEQIIPFEDPEDFVSIFQFLWVWIDLLVALIYLGGNPEVAPMTVTISNLVNSYGGGWVYLTAAAFISMIVPLVIFYQYQLIQFPGINNHSDNSA